VRESADTTPIETNRGTRTFPRLYLCFTESEVKQFF